MHEIIDQFIKIGTSPFISILSFLLGVLGVILAIIFYLKSKRFKRLSYEYVNRTLIDDIGNRLEGLTVSYNNTQQPRVTISRFILWNSGTETIDHLDIASSSPIQLKIDNDVSLLGLKVVTTSSESIQFEAELSKSLTTDEYLLIPLSFEYLDKDDGVVLQLVHTGKEDTKIKIDGKIKGSKGINRLISPAFRTDGIGSIFSQAIGFNLFHWVGGLTYLAIGVISFFQLFTNFSTNWWFIFPGLFCFYGAFVMLRMTKDHVPIMLINEL